MRKFLGSVLAVGVAVLAFATPSQAGDDAALLTVTCKGGNLTVQGKAPWHTNHEAPWKWDKGEKTKLDKDAFTAHGAKCEGSVKAFICNGDQCKGPISAPVTESK